ncbi:MAG TPA: MarR family transcriptional regulator [Clostridium sp.]
MKKNDVTNILVDNNNSKIELIDLFTEMINVSQLLNKIKDQFYKKFQITQIQFRALSVIYVCEERNVKLSVLSEKLNITRPSVTALIDRMECAGLVERSSNKDDRRSIGVVITDKGKEIMKTVLPNNKAFEVSIADFLTEEEKENLYKITIKLKEELTQKFLKD